MKKLILIATLISFNLILLEGCSTGPSNSVNSEPVAKQDPDKLEVFLGSSKDFTQPIRFEQNIGLHAKGSGPVIIISMQNQGQDNIEIIPQNFGLITGNNKSTDLIRITPGSADLSGFSPLLLTPGDQGTRRLVMTTTPNVSGTRLVFNYPPKGIQFFVPVE